MGEAKIHQGQGFRVEIPPNAMQATLLTDEGAAVSAAAVISKLKSIGIASFDDGDLIEWLEARQLKAASLVVAWGTPPVAGKAGKLNLQVPICDSATGQISKVVPGQMIANCEPANDGVDGKDVFGRIVPAKPAPPAMKDGVTLQGRMLRSGVIGNVRMDKESVSVFPLMEIASEKSEAAIRFNGDVLVRGRLTDGRNLQASGCLIVTGTIGAASFKVGAWAHVSGGLIGRGQAAGIVANDMRVEGVSDSTLIVGGDLVAQNTIENSRVACAGTVGTERITITGGTVSANGGINARVIGSFTNTPTALEAGSDPTLKSVLAKTRAEVTELSKQAAALRGRLEPLQHRMKNLTAAEKEQVTELMDQVGELDQNIGQKINFLTMRCREAADRSKTEIVALGKIFPNVVIRFPGMQAKTSEIITGPVKFYPRIRDQKPEIVYETSDGIVHPLVTTAIPDLVTPCVKRLAAGRMAA